MRVRVRERLRLRLRLRVMSRHVEELTHRP